MDALKALIEERFASEVSRIHVALDELTVELPASHLLTVCTALRDESDFDFSLLLDICGVDYSRYGMADWQTRESTSTGFSRGVQRDSEPHQTWNKPRFAVIYHLLSIKHNTRIRLRVFVDEASPLVPSVINVWQSADWFEREAFDLYGILFQGHPDLRRILTDYGFIGHPFRKDFPLSGQVEMRYDATLGRCVYEPVSIVPRVLVPKVIRDDQRYASQEDVDG